MKIIRCLLLLIALTTLGFANGLAAAPFEFNYQGMLLEGTDGPPLEGVHDLSFRIYAGPGPGGTALWTEVHAGVEVSKGQFSVILGSVTAIPDNLFADGERWLGVTVDAEEEISPRMKIVSVPWAMRSAASDVADAVAWDNISGMPPGFADGIDNVGGGAGDGHSLDASDGDPIDVVYVDESGDVGINTTTPATYLHIVGLPTGARGQFSITAPATEDVFFSFYEADNFKAYLWYDDSDDDLRLQNVNNFDGGDLSLNPYGGNVGIGTIAPGEMLEVAGTIFSTTGGFRFPDGSLQTTAAAGGGLTLPYSGSATTTDAVFDIENLTTSPGVGIRGTTNGLGSGVAGVNASANTSGSLGHSQAGVAGWSSSNRVGYLGYGLYGVYGESGTVAVRGENTVNDNWGELGGTYGVEAGADINNIAIYGKNFTNAYGYLGGHEHGVYGRVAVEDDENFTGAAVYAINTASGSWAKLGAVGGAALSTSSAPANWAGFFDGHVHITGDLTGGKKSILLDHPQDPENRLLRQNVVASSEDLLIYRGKTSLDGKGEAKVVLPGYFKALANEEEATVTLTSIGKPFLTGYEWLPGNQDFIVFGDPGREVSWVVYVERDDPVARYLAKPVEVEKGTDMTCDPGKLLHPEAYGYSEDRAQMSRNP
jgi:hypothetical protein